MPENFTTQAKNMNEISLSNFSPTSEPYEQSENFFHGLYHLYNKNFSEARKHLVLAVNNTEQMDVTYFEYLSFLGLVEVLLHESRGGLNRCYEALNGFSNIPELYINLAYAELSLGDRRRCVVALEYCIEKNPDFIYANQIINCSCLGKRKPAALKNRKDRKSIFKKLFRKNESQCLTETIDEIFQLVLIDKLKFYTQDRT